jgi:lactoylglutathione lyase
VSFGEAVIRLHHAGVHVSDLARSAQFYQRVFGLSLSRRLSFGSEQLVFLSAGDALLELIADGQGERPTGVVDHVAFEVADIDAWLIQLRQRGVRLVDHVPVDVPQLNARILFCLGPDGERIELFQQRDGHQ